jgi:hypothetical protein
MTHPALRPLTLSEGREALRFCNSFNRLPHLIELAWSFDQWTDWLILLGEEWTGCDNIAQFADSLFDETPFADLLREPEFRAHLMTPAEQAALAALPDEVEIFRGCYAHNKWGLSWSLDRSTAERFPLLHRYRHEGQPLLVRARIAKADILAVKLCRDEAEVIAARAGRRRGPIGPKHISTSHIAVEG